MARLVKVNFRETVNVSMKMQCRRKFRSITRWMIFLPVLSRLRIQEERINLSPQQKMKTFLLPFRQVDFALLIPFRDKWGELEPSPPLSFPPITIQLRILYIIALYSFFSFFLFLFLIACIITRKRNSSPFLGYTRAFPLRLPLSLSEEF